MTSVDGRGQIATEIDGEVMWIVIDRPEVLNAMATVHVRQLVRELLRAWRADGIGAVVITGRGRAFCAGHDLTSGEEGAMGAAAWNHLFEVIATMPKPVVAAVNGAAAGGGLNLALTCDLAYCVDDAKLVHTFVNIGACADTGGHLYLLRSAGHQRASELLLLGRGVRGSEAVDLGLFAESLPTDDALQARVVDVARQLANGPPLSHAVTRRGLEYARTHSAEEVLRWDAGEIDQLARSRDMQEGIRAFLAKRPPRFTGG